MRKLIKISLFLFITIILSCEDSVIICDDCLEEIPDRSRLYINVRRLSRTDSFYHITVFRGKIEDGIIVDERETYSDYSLVVSLNQEYSALLTQVVDGTEYNAVDATTIKAESHDDYCDRVCYIIKDDVLNLKFKYY